MYQEYGRMNARLARLPPSHAPAFDACRDTIGTTVFDTHLSSTVHVTKRHEACTTPLASLTYSKSMEMYFRPKIWMRLGNFHIRDPFLFL